MGLIFLVIHVELLGRIDKEKGVAVGVYAGLDWNYILPKIGQNIMTCGGIMIDEL